MGYSMNRRKDGWTSFTFSSLAKTSRCINGTPRPTEVRIMTAKSALPKLLLLMLTAYLCDNGLGAGSFSTWLAVLGW